MKQKLDLIMDKRKFFTQAGVLLVLLFIASQQLLAQMPGVEWSQITCPPKTFNGAPQTLAQSGEDWWYSHKNVYNSSGTQTGYIMVGYSSLVSTAATFAGAQTMYNEGTNSPCNPINTTNYNYTATVDCRDRDYNGEIRTPTRGNIGLADLKGNMVWCKPRTNWDIQEVIQDPNNANYIYVIGAHLGSKPFNTGYATFLPYNPTASHPSDYFSNTALGSPAITDGMMHAYVAKIDITVTGGSVVWEALYGYLDYSAGALTAYNDITNGYDIIMSSTGNLVIVGTAIAKVFLMTINPSNGYVIGKNVLPINFSNPDRVACSGGNGHSLIEIGTSGNYAVAGMHLYPNPDGTYHDVNNAFVWCVNSSLNPASWTTNPIQIFGSLPASPSGTYYNSNVWEIKYHAGLQQLLVPVVRDCKACAAASNVNDAYGYIYRYDVNGVLIPPITGGPNPSPMGEVSAYDLRIGVEPASDGGFIAVSSTRPPGEYHTPASPNELGYLSTCAFDPNDFNGFWDTDALVVKYFSFGGTQWIKTFDVSPNRSRQTPPGDLKLQECLYKISQAQDGGYVISGNSSYDFDDNYLVKLYSECNIKQPYTYGPSYIMNITSNTTWNSSKNIMGKVVVQPNCSLVVTGSTTKIRFADTKMTGITTNITVMPGGRLDIINGAELTSIDNSICPGSMWDGIFVQGNSMASQNYSLGFAPSQGLVSMATGAIISNARNAITTGVNSTPATFNWGTTGGIISASNSSFINNGRDVQLMYFHNPVSNRSVFTNCQFLVTGKLNDGSNPIGRISMYETQGVKINACKFSYSGGAAYADANRGYGIYSMDAQYNVGSCLNPPACTSNQQSRFENLTVGIQAANSISARVVNVDNSVFTGNYSDGICFSTMSAPNITRNTITTNANKLNSAGIYVNNCQNYVVSNNVINGNGSNGVGIYASYSGAGNHQIYRNTINNLYLGIVPQYDNSGINNHADGLVMNCNDFTGVSNAYDVCLQGAYPNGVGTTVSDIQGILTTPPNPQSFVRNQYAAPCGNDNKWLIWPATYNKTIQHASFNTTSTQPNYPTTGCADPLVNVVVANGIAFSPQDCPSSLTTPFCPCPACCRLGNINHVLDSVRTVFHTTSNNYNATVDRGSTTRLLGYIAAGTLSALKDTLLSYGAYLSDTVMSAYFHRVATTAAQVIAVHHNNAPVNPIVWKTILNRGFSTGDMSTLNSQQVASPISARQVLDGQLTISRNLVQGVYASKLNYFLTDSLAASKDSMIQMLYKNTGGLPNTQLQLVNAYRNAGNYSRAFFVTDSFAAISAYTELMTLQKVFLKLDTSANKAFTLLNNPELYSIVTTYAADSTKQGSSMARAMLKFVKGNDMYLPRLLPTIGGSRYMSDQTSVQQTNSTGQKPDDAKRFLVYPNPTDGNFNLLYQNDGNDVLWYNIYDIMGKVLSKGNVIRSVLTEISGEDLKAGIYFITVGNGKQTLSQQKLVITK